MFLMNPSRTIQRKMEPAIVRVVSSKRIPMPPRSGFCAQAGLFATALPVETPREAVFRVGSPKMVSRECRIIAMDNNCGLALLAPRRRKRKKPEADSRGVHNPSRPIEPDTDIWVAGYNQSLKIELKHGLLNDMVPPTWEIGNRGEVRRISCAPSLPKLRFQFTPRWWGFSHFNITSDLIGGPIVTDQGVLSVLLTSGSSDNVMLGAPLQSLLALLYRCRYY